MMGREQFQKVKDGLLFINSARADLVDQRALLESVNNGKVAMASIDVLEPEPPFDLHPEKHNYQHQLLKNPKIIVTPHICASKVEAQKGTSFNLAEQLKKTLIS